MRDTSVLLSVSGLALSAAFLSACGRDAQAITPENVEQRYGVPGAYADSVATPDGLIKGTVVPVTLADGRKAQWVIPAQSSKDPHGVYMRDGNGLHPVEVSERASRADLARSPAVVDTRPDRAHARKRRGRSLERWPAGARARPLAVRQAVSAGSFTILRLGTKTRAGTD